MSSDLLFEVGFWGLPFEFVRPDFTIITQKNFEGVLSQEKWKVEKITLAISSRRFGFLLSNISDQGEGEIIEIRGPKVSIAYDLNGLPTPAAEGFASRLGVSLSDLYVKEVDGEKFVFAKKTGKTRNLLEEAPKLIVSILKSVPWNCSEWRKEAFFPHPPVRLCCLVDSEVPEFKLDDLKAGKETIVFVKGKELKTSINNASDYLQLFLENGNILIPEERRKSIELQLQALCKPGETIRKDQYVINRVSFECENPQPCVCVLPVNQQQDSDLPLILGVSRLFSGLLFETTKGELLPKMVSFFDSVAPFGKNVEVVEKTLAYRIVRVRDRWISEKIASFDDLIAKLALYPSQYFETLLEEAKSICKLLSKLYQSVECKMELLQMERFVFQLLSVRTSSLCFEYPMISSAFLRNLSREFGEDGFFCQLLAETADYLYNDGEIPPVQGTLPLLAIFITRLSVKSKDVSEKIKTSMAEKVMQLTLKRNILLDFGAIEFDYENTFPEVEYWENIFKKQLPNFGFSEDAPSNLLGRKSFIPVLVMEALNNWKEKYPPEIDIIRSLYSRIRSKFSNFQIMNKQQLDGLSTQEEALYAKLVDLEASSVIPLKSFFTKLIETRIEIEACLMDLPPLIDETDPVKQTRANLLKRVLAQISRVPFLVPISEKTN